MTFERRRIFAAVGLVAFALAGAAWLLRLDYARKISTDVLDLIPAADRAPELALVRSMASEQEARTMLFVLEADGAAEMEGSRKRGGAEARNDAGLEAARRFAEELRRETVFAQAVALGDPSWRDAAGKELFELRFALLFPKWLAARADRDVARTAATELKAFLERPEALAYQDLVPADPLLLLPDALQRLRSGLAMLGGMQGATAKGTGLVWAQLAVSPLREEGQAPAFAAVERALAEVRRAHPGIQVSYTGVNRFAAASRARIEREVSWLNAASLAAVLGVAVIFIRAVHRALHLVPVIAFATLGAWVATTVAFERVHVIVFALGALLTGVAIDYGFYLYMQPPAGPGETYPDKVRRLAKPLLASCATTVAGFALLLFSDFPMIRQLGVFVGAGLVCALGAAVLYFALLRNTFLEARRFGGRGGRWGDNPKRRWVRRALVAGWLAAGVGLTRVTWHDDIRELEVPARELQAEDAQIRAAFGQGAGRGVYLTHGATLAEAREALARFEGWIGGRVALANFGVVVPTQAEREVAAKFMRERKEFPAEMRRALEAEGFAAEEFGTFFEAYQRYGDGVRVGGGEFEHTARKLADALTGPLGLLLHVGAEKSWFVTIAQGAMTETPPPETQTVAVSQLQSLNRLFAGYRASALRLSLAGLALVGLGVFLTYGLRDGARIFAIPCGACVGIFGVFGWVGIPLNMFHLLGAFLGVCLTHNYSIFSATSAYRREGPPVSVRLSALTTGASFGVLALSSIPVVRALGMTVAAMVALALLVIELEHLSPLAKETKA